MKVVPIEVEYIDHCGSDLSTVNAARVSFNKRVSEMSAADEKLIHYLAKHKHLSPFNHCFISVRVKAPIFVARQLVKHEYIPWNEVSRRYVDNDPEFYIPEVWRNKADSVKQGSEGVHRHSMVYTSDADDLCRECLSEYQSMIKQGVCAEQARMILPQNVMTEWIGSGTLGAFAKMLGLRLDPHTQKETRDVAELIYPIVKKHFPISLQALLDNK
jgi:thymidylate synthase (FAD)